MAELSCIVHSVSWLSSCILRSLLSWWNFNCSTDVFWYENVLCLLGKNCIGQPFSIVLPWRNPWNNFQVSGNPCIKIIISTAHGTLTWSVSCRYNNPIIIVNAVLSREWYFFSGSVYFGQEVQKTMFIFFQSWSLAEPLATSCGTPVEKPWYRLIIYLYNRQGLIDWLVIFFLPFDSLQRKT
jgi:hypothetical protein